MITASSRGGVGVITATSGPDAAGRGTGERDGKCRCHSAPPILGRVWTLTLPREVWRRIIDTLRAKGLPYMVQHADVLAQRIDQAPADRDLVRLSMSDDLFYRSVWWASWVLGIRLPATPG